MNGHLDRFFRLKCSSRLAAIYPDSKEVTESFAVYEAARQALGTDLLHDRSILAICPGDGVTPRTGALAAMRSAWTVKSVDIKMRTRWCRNTHGIHRLTCVRGRAEDFAYQAPRILILATHSHAPLAALIGRCECDRLDVVTLPCCVKDGIGEPTRSYEDADCISPCRRVNVYLDHARALAAVA